MKIFGINLGKNLGLNLNNRKPEIIERKSNFSFLTKGFTFGELFNGFVAKYITNSNDKQILELLNSNSDLVSIISKISQRVGMLGFGLEKDGVELDKPRFKKIVKDLDKIFGINGFETFKKDFYSYLFATGEIYLYKIVDEKGKFKCFEILPNKIISRKNITNNGIFESITLTTGRTLINNIDFYWFQKDKKYSSENPFNSIGILESIKLDLLQDLEIQKRNIAYFRNASLPAFIVRYFREGVDENALNKTKANFDAIYQGSENYGKVLHTTNIEGVEKLESTNTNTYEPQRQYITEKLCALLGIDKETLGYKTSNGSEAKLKEINNDINSFTIPAYAKFLEYVINSIVKVNSKEIENGENFLSLNIILKNALLDNKLDIETSQREDLKVGILTINEIRQERGLGPLETQDTQDLQTNIGENGTNGTKEPSGDEKAPKTKERDL